MIQDNNQSRKQIKIEDETKQNVWRNLSKTLSISLLFFCMNSTIFFSFAFLPFPFIIPDLPLSIISIFFI